LNQIIERYNRTVRYDWLAQFLFDSIEKVQEYATRWLWTYNHERPNMGLGGITPIQKLAMVASEWVPDDSLTDSSGSVSSEYLWAVLDCPGAYAFPELATGTILLGELAVSIKESVMVGEKCVLIGWEISHEGRKHYTGTALFGESGKCRAVGYATWFEVPKAPNQKVS
jgi:hypothetical protein